MNGDWACGRVGGVGWDVSVGGVIPTARPNKYTHTHTTIIQQHRCNNDRRRRRRGGEDIAGRPPPSFSSYTHTNATSKENNFLCVCVLFMLLASSSAAAACRVRAGGRTHATKGGNNKIVCVFGAGVLRRAGFGSLPERCCVSAAADVWVVFCLLRSRHLWHSIWCAGRAI